MTKSPFGRVCTAAPIVGDDADELVADALAAGRFRGRVVGVQVAAADAGAGDLHQGVGGFDDRAGRGRR